MAALAESCPLLRRVDLSGCIKLTDAGVGAIASRCACLRALSLAGCRGLTDDALLQVGVQCPTLAALSISGVGPTVSDAGIHAVAVGAAAALRMLDLGACAAIGDGAVLALALHCPGLRSLDLSALSDDPRRYLTDRGVRALSRGCRGLGRLRLGGCIGVTDSGLRAALRLLPTLELLSVDGGGAQRAQAQPRPHAHVDRLLHQRMCDVQLHGATAALNAVQAVDSDVTAWDCLTL